MLITEQACYKRHCTPQKNKRKSSAAQAALFSSGLSCFLLFPCSHLALTLHGVSPSLSFAAYLTCVSVVPAVTIPSSVCRLCLFKSRHIDIDIHNHKTTTRQPQTTTDNRHGALLPFPAVQKGDRSSRRGNSNGSGDSDVHTDRPILQRHDTDTRDRILSADTTPAPGYLCRHTHCSRLFHSSS